MTDNDRLTQIKARLESASPYPWALRRITSCLYSIRSASGAILGEFALPKPEANAAFVANAPDDIAWLIQALEAAHGRSELESSEED